MFLKLDVGSARFINPKSNAEIKLYNVEFFYDTKKLLIKLASEKRSNFGVQPLHEFIIDSFTAEIEDYKLFSFDESISFESPIFLTDNLGVTYLYKLRINHIRLKSLNNDLLREHDYYENDGEFITVKKRFFTSSSISIDKIEDDD